MRHEMARAMTDDVFHADCAALTALPGVALYVAVMHVDPDCEFRGLSFQLCPPAKHHNSQHDPAWV
jgi:hypothetical protein